MRWRPPTRPLILIALLLLAGAVVNIAVAWVLVGAPESWTPGRKVRDPSIRISVALPSEERRRAVAVELGAPSDWPLPAHAEIDDGLGWRFIFAGWFDGGSIWTAHRIDCGWPARALMIRGDMAPTPPASRDMTYSPSFAPPRWALPGPGWFRAYRDRLPLTPLPTGFAINTLFYAAILALPLSFFPVRRRLRARRGRCPKCGYDLAGLGARKDAESAASCPECGATR